ncbi:uncharacterized protein K02A2.6-like [Alligator mississippiensis]|uniref:uncharacterized protein K02A2.6-like n=1 Tax=Alligator mississippiensis TaxID=8496 RepID=UPI0028776142|nr:uncharacterized protein K02A2.6-like [Alligator mississippiensis]
MTSTERNYAQTDKETLANIAGVKKKSQLCSWPQIQNLNRPQTPSWNFTMVKRTPPILSPHMQCWSIMLNTYDYTLMYKSGKMIANVDALSHLPLQIPDCATPPPMEVLMLESVPEAPLQADQIAWMTAKYLILAHVLNWVRRGWPADKLAEKFRPFSSHQHELSAHKGCLLCGSCVIIPEAGCQTILTTLHAAHLGIVRMKALARSHVWWPGMDNDIERVVRESSICQATHHNLPKAPVFPWEMTNYPWSCIRIDVAGTFQGKNFLIVVELYSKWLEVITVSTLTSTATVTTLCQLFATHGVPDTVVSENGSAFTSAEFQDFASCNLIRTVFIVPCRPQANGHAERMVQTTKDALKRIIVGDWPTRLTRFLFAQHVISCPTTGSSSSELLIGHHLKTCLDRVNPDLVRDMQFQKDKDLDFALASGTLCLFIPQETVFAQNYGTGPQWVQSKIVSVTGPISYIGPD